MLADALAQLKGAKEALPHLNRLVAYAPSYALSHLKLAVQLAREEDWDSVRAACLNALRVSIDRADAGYAYYRLAQAAWMRDEFAVAVAAYMMSDAVAPNQVPSLGEELSEVRTFRLCAPWSGHSHYALSERRNCSCTASMPCSPMRAAATASVRAGTNMP